MMNVSSPAIENNNVYVGIDFYLVATNIQGKTLWRFTAGDEIASSPAVSGNTVYVGSYDGYRCSRLQNQSNYNIIVN